MERMDFFSLGHCLLNYPAKWSSWKKILHCRGVRQGDPLSPMLFLLTIEPLHMLFKKAHQLNLLQKLRPNCDTYRVSLYADAAALFIQPNEKELQVVDHILHIFVESSGLVTNMSKINFYPIRCEGISLVFLAQANREVSNFPYTYLGLPLNTRKPTRVELQPLLLKIANILPGWKRDFLSYPSRELLMKVVLSSMPTHFLSVFKLSQWAIKNIDRFRRSFFWRGKTPIKSLEVIAWLIGQLVLGQESGEDLGSRT
jgi:hypothetical protein